jgi:ACR3 family arsenite efflux pump ArsB
LNLVIGPAVMFSLAWLLLPDLSAISHRADK